MDSVCKQLEDSLAKDYIHCNIDQLADFVAQYSQDGRSSRDFIYCWLTNAGPPRGQAYGRLLLLDEDYYDTIQHALQNCLPFTLKFYKVLVGPISQTIQVKFKIESDIDVKGILNL